MAKLDRTVVCAGRRRSLDGIFATAIISTLIYGCGQPEPEAKEQIVEREGALGTFGAWTKTPSGLLRYGSSIAGSDSAGTTLVGIGTDNDVYTSNSLDAGGLGAIWRISSNFGLASATPTLVPVVAAVGITGESASLRNAIAIAYQKPDEGNIYVRIQNTTGSVVIHDWDRIPAPTTFAFIALAWAPQSALAGPQRTLYLIATGRDLPTSPFYVSTNTLTGGVYNHANWTVPTPPPVPGGASLPIRLGDVAAAWACPPTSSDYSLVVASTQPISPSPSTQAYFTRFSPSRGWTPFQLAQNGVLYGSIGLAAGCSATSHEMSLFGTGTDLRVYATTQIGGGPATWSLIGNQTFAGEFNGQDKPGWSAVHAGSSGSNVWLTTTDHLAPYYNSTTATPTTSCLVGWQNNSTCAPLCTSRVQSDQRACVQVLNCYRDSNCGPGTCDTGNQACGPNSIGAGNAPYPFAQQVVNCIPGCPH